LLGGNAFTGGTRGRRSIGAIAALILALSLTTPSSAGAAETTALAVEIAAPARAVHGSDGHGHIEYDLVIANVFTAPVQLESIEVSGSGRRLLTLRGTALREHTLALDKPTATVAVSAFVKTLVDVVLPRSFGRRVPRALTERIRYSIPNDAPTRPVIGSTVVRGPTVPVAPQTPVRIASPVYGSGWLNASGCCADPTSEHRTLLLGADGSLRTPEMFTIDWIREAGGRFFTGDGTKLSDWPGFGAPIHAVAGGVVVSAVNNLPDVPPFISLNDNHSIRRPRDFGGNNVVERIAPGEYAFYAHLQTGSVRVRAGQRVRTGQVLGLLGNTGNTSGPHLHFGIQDGPDVLTSDSLPYAIGSFTFQGTGTVSEATPGKLVITGRRRHVTLSEPLVRGVFSF
jgi:hypothetical protein